MTAIACLARGGDVWMAGDHGATGLLGDTQTRRDPKVWKLDDYVFGVSGSFRQIDIMRYVWTAPVYTNGDDLKGHMVRKVVPSLRSCLEDNGLQASAEEQATDPMPGTVLAGLHGHLFEISADYQVAEPEDPFWALGCGSMVTLGALSIMNSRSLFGDANPEWELKMALTITAKYSAPVRAPFTVVTTGDG